jgi:hypothetical protein
MSTSLIAEFCVEDRWHFRSSAHPNPHSRSVS